MEKVLSIVVPTYNMEKYLEKCLTSLIVTNELMECLEVLVINDGSNDRSSLIAHEYNSRFPHTFCVIDKENGNYGSCINRGLKESTGKYFRILDADDWFDNESLTAFLIYLQQENSDLIITPRREYHKESIEEISLSPNLQYNVPYDLNNFKFDNVALRLLLRMHSMTYKTSVLRECELRHQTGISYTDTEYCYYPIRFSKSVVFVNTNLYQYNNNRAGQTIEVESYVKSNEQIYKVIHRMLLDYADTKNYCNGVMNYNRGQFIKNLCNIYYPPTILYGNKNKEKEIQMREIADLIKKELPEIHTFLLNLKKNRLPFYKLWYLYGLYGTSFLLTAYNNVYSLLSSAKHLQIK